MKIALIPGTQGFTMALRGNTVRRLGKWLFTYEDSANVVRIKDLVLNPVNA